MNKDKFISAQVSPRLLETVSRMFSGDVSGRITELLQNARRAGATEVHIKNTLLRPGVYMVTVEDNGVGVKDFSALLDAGRTEWNSEVQNCEDPAGMGVFCLSPRTTMISSGKETVCVEGDGWMGIPVPIRNLENHVEGTRFEFEDIEWGSYHVKPCAKYSGLTVYVDGALIDTIPFMNTEHPIRHIPELGVKLQVFEGQGYRDGFKINFFGQVINSTQLDKVLPTDILIESPRRYHNFNTIVRVELTGEPTELRMVLPARDDIVINKASKQLGAEIEKEYYRYVKTLAEHSLPYRSYMRAHQLGIELEESAVYLRGAFDLYYPTRSSSECIILPASAPIKLHFEAKEFAHGPAEETVYVSEESDKCVSQIIARSLEEDSLDVRWIPEGYEEYSWAKKIPVAKELTIDIGPTLFVHDSDDIYWECVKHINYTLELTDGKEMTGSLQSCPSTDFQVSTYTAEGSFMVTKDYLRANGPSDVLDHLDLDGTMEGDDKENFYRDYEKFSSLREGEHEYHREQIVSNVSQSIVGICCDYDKPQYWKSVHISNDGTVTITYNDDSEFVMKRQ